MKITNILREDKKHYLLNNNKAKAKENKLIIKAEIETVKSKKAHIKYLLIFNYSFLNKKWEPQSIILNQQHVIRWIIINKIDRFIKMIKS